MSESSITNNQEFGEISLVIKSIPFKPVATPLKFKWSITAPPLAKINKLLINHKEYYVYLASVDGNKSSYPIIISLIKIEEGEVITEDYRKHLTYEEAGIDIKNFINSKYPELVYV
jgi:hypothetical protein